MLIPNMLPVGATAREHEAHVPCMPPSGLSSIPPADAHPREQVQREEERHRPVTDGHEEVGFRGPVGPPPVGFGESRKDVLERTLEA